MVTLNCSQVFRVKVGTGGADMNVTDLLLLLITLMVAGLLIFMFVTF
jgi:hypothetical protein